MKTTSFLTLGLSLLLLAYSCDKIEQPVNDVVPSGLEDLDFTLFPGEASDYPEPIFELMAGGEKNVLLEEYTGHKCTNCPPAAALAESIAEESDGRVILVSLHSSTTGDFQAVSSSHPTDFTTEAGNTYVTSMEGFIGNPQCSIDRVSNSIFGSVWHLTQDWEQRSAERLEAEHELNIQMVANHYEETNGLFVHVNLQPLVDLQGDMSLIVYLLRDEVVSPQSLLDGSIDEDYVHKHVLSQNINGTWGTPTGLDTVQVGGMETYHYSYALPSEIDEPTYNPENLSLVALVLNRETDEVLQSIYQHITP